MMHTITVFVEICLLIAALLLSFATIIEAVCAVVRYIIRRRRRRAVERRIIANAKAGDVWDKPHLLGGRALDLYARDMCGLKRAAGETDRNLRARCAAAGIKPQKRKAGRRQ